MLRSASPVPMTICPGMEIPPSSGYGLCLAKTDRGCLRIPLQCATNPATTVFANSRWLTSKNEVCGYVNHIGSCPPARGRGAKFSVGTFSARSTTRNSTDAFFDSNLSQVGRDLGRCQSLERRAMLERHRRAPRKCWLGGASPLRRMRGEHSHDLCHVQDRPV